jgi:diguanylate cyclase (GGDEF)-like protein
VIRFVRTSLARRLFVLFVLSAFLPLAAIAVLSLSQVRSLLLQQGEQRLSAMAKTYGMTLFERLLLASELAAAAAENPAAGASPDSMAARTFRSLARIDPAGTVPIIGAAPQIGLLSDSRARLAAGRSVVIVLGEGDAARILIAAPLPQHPGSIAIGELRPGPLWGPSDEVPAATSFCVLEEGARRPLYCSEPVPQSVLESLHVEGQSFASATWTREGETFRSRAWSQFLRAGFGTSDWIVVASQPESHQLAQVFEFRKLYIPVVVLALLLVTWLTVRQTRNIADPVEKLAERALGIANNDFATRLDLKRDDELGALADAFDQMSKRLGRQFASLSALSEIDRLILATQDTVQVVRIVLHRLGDAIPADVASITLFDSDGGDEARTYFRPEEAADSMSMEVHSVGAAERGALGADSRGRWMELGLPASTPSYLAPLRVHGIRTAYVQPIVWRGAVCGTLALGYRDPASLEDEDRRQAREMADRVAVAVSSAWRDDQLYDQAHFDPLTGLPNRLLFHDRLQREILRSEREGVTFALLIIDLDHFKNVNDSFGHTAGDKVLAEAARRISRCLRESDTVSRLGGDEFTVLLARLGHAQEAWILAETVVAALSQEFNLGEQRCFLSASVGIASYPADGATAEELLKSADIAMYRAKASGRAQVVFFEEKMNREAVARVTLDRDLRAAIDRSELVLHYQPQVDVRSGKIRGAEALVRWNHPEHGLISPLRFIPLAEESGFIEQIGRWVFEQACTQMKEWRARGLSIERISVNVSPRQFRRRDLAVYIRECMLAAGLPPSCLELEITEGLLLERGEAVEGMLRELADDGHRIALDDFGTGFSSMAYLQRFPVHTIKIDRVFIERLDGNADAEAIVAAIIAMSHALGKNVIAEGVETIEQLALLRRLQCDEFQGFLVAPGLAPEAFEAFLVASVEAVPALG